MHSSPKPKKQILLEAKRLSKIPYSSKPLPQGGEIVYLTPEAFEEKFQFTYTESLFGNPEALQDILSNTKFIHHLKNRPDLPSEQLVIDRLNNPLDTLVVCEMGNHLGHGLFINADYPAGTILGIYAGLIEDAEDSDPDDSYGMAWGHSDLNTATKKVSSKTHGGLTRFMQHLPIDPARHKAKVKAYLQNCFPEALLRARNIDIDKVLSEKFSEVKDHEFEGIECKDENLKAKFTTSNVVSHHMVIRNMIVHVISAAYDLKKFEQVGFSYGETYWLTGKMKPAYFYHDGSIIPRMLYKTKGESSLPQANPLVVYGEGIKLYKVGQLNDAALKFHYAIDLFQALYGMRSIERANCFAALASCYRDLGEKEKAKSTAENALIIYQTHQAEEKIQNLIPKYQEILKYYDPQTLYKEAIDWYKKAEYYRSIYLLNYLVTVFNTASEKTLCYSSLASSYRELKKLPMAVLHAEKALDCCSHSLTKSQALIESTQKKLEDLKKLAALDVALEADSLKMESSAK